MSTPLKQVYETIDTALARATGTETVKVLIKTPLSHEQYTKIKMGYELTGKWSVGCARWNSLTLFFFDPQEDEE